MAGDLRYGRSSFIAFLCGLVIAIAVLMAIADRKNKRAARKVPLPQYTVTGAALSPNATLSGNLLTGDFVFTLRAHNPYQNTNNKTIFYGNTTEVTLGCRRFTPFRITNAPPSSLGLLLPLMGPASLPPGNDSPDIALELHVRNMAFPDDDGSGKTSCDMALAVSFHAAFREEEVESKRRQASVRCSPLTFTYETKNFTGDYVGACATSRVEVEVDI
ncbi:hypothetical protein DM860_000212 [Cuscuta australis]|uniref:Late embryogenesis abundant protein LEA-2 subgroup domain-containing protein n=1 Tax=Cuscuta australis TaxID=267555 RepID=A0A328CYK1_9ASTE|nr:hypothetical protein DM860_000212 [Cuscuta australis]